jgi:putative ABC transport system permease protein
MALGRLPQVEAVVPMALGSARVEAEGRGRSVFVYGVTPEIAKIFRFRPRQGSFWPSGDPRRGFATAVLGPTLKRELFEDQPVLGRFVRIAGSRFRVTGVMEPKGRMLGFDIDDAVYIPVASAMRIFNLAELTEIDLIFHTNYSSREVEAAVRAVISARHGGEDDVSVNTQEAMLEVFGNVMNIVTVGVASIAGVSRSRSAPARSGYCARSARPASRCSSCSWPRRQRSRRWEGSSASSAPFRSAPPAAPCCRACRSIPRRCSSAWRSP